MASSTSVTTWDFRDALDMRAASALVGEGLQLCSITGFPLSFESLGAGSVNGGFGIMLDNPAQDAQPRRLFGLIGPKVLRKIVMGNLWLINKPAVHHLKAGCSRSSGASTWPPVRPSPSRSQPN